MDGQLAALLGRQGFAALQRRHQAHAGTVGQEHRAVQADVEVAEMGQHVRIVCHALDACAWPGASLFAGVPAGGLERTLGDAHVDVHQDELGHQ